MPAAPFASVKEAHLGLSEGLTARVCRRSWRQDRTGVIVAARQVFLLNRRPPCQESRLSDMYDL